MAAVAREAIRTGSLLSSTNRVDAPFVKVTLGGYTFGVYDKSRKITNSSGVVSDSGAMFPNYVQSLQCKTINGTVNQYTLQIKYPVTQNSDPNFFEKLFSSVSSTREIQFDYGDATMPNYIYRNQKAIITDVQTSFDIKNSTINYTVEATAASQLTLSGSYIFPAVTDKPSKIIKNMLNSSKYRLTEVYTAMKDRDFVEECIAADDAPVTIPTFKNVGVLEYISTLVSYMHPVGTSGSSAITSGVYVISNYDDENGPYFKVQKLASAGSYMNDLCTYELDIGYQTANIVTDFRLNDNKNWSIFYDYSVDESNNSNYRSLIDSDGHLVRYYSPQLRSNTNEYRLTSRDLTWWTKVTQYPIKVTVVMKGLLRPTVLMQYVKLNVWMYGHKHISSGYYIINSQVDSIGTNGYFTTLELIRVSEDTEAI